MTPPDEDQLDQGLGRLTALVGGLVLATALCVASYLEADGARVAGSAPGGAACPGCGTCDAPLGPTDQGAATARSDVAPQRPGRPS